MISVIIPTLNEAEYLPACLGSLDVAGPAPVPHEVIVVDGCSSDRTRQVAYSFGAHVISAPWDRARLMNAGVAAARGDALLFLHADSRLPTGALAYIQDVMGRPEVVGGRFRLRLDATGVAFRAVEAAIALLGLFWRGFTGDRAIFVRRSVFEEIDGYADLPLLEDIDLSLRMCRVGKVVLAPLSVVTSARRWQRWGTVRTTTVMCIILAAYRLGVSPARLAQFYRRLDTR